MPYPTFNDGPPRHLVFTLVVVVAVSLVATLAVPQTLADGDPPQAPEWRSGLLSADKPISAMEAYRAVARDADIEVLFATGLRDSDVEVQGLATPFGVGWPAAFDKISLSAGHFWTRIDKSTVMVANDTPQQRRQFEPISVARFTLDHIEVKDAMTIVRSLLGAKHVAASEEPNTLVVRDTTRKIDVIEVLIQEIDRPQDELSVQVELLHLDPTDFRRLTADGVQVERAAIETLLNQGSAQPLLSTSVGLRGFGPERVEIQQRAPQNRTVGFEAKIASHVDRSTRDVRLDLRMSIASRGPDSDQDGQPDLLRSQSMSSAWRVADGGTVLIEIADSDLATLSDSAPARGAVVLALTPSVTHLGTTANIASFAVGTESDLRLAGSLDADGSSDSRQAIRERLRERLRTLPRNLQDRSPDNRDSSTDER